MPEQKHIDDFFREQMAGHSEAPPPAAWKNLEQKLDSTATPGSVVSYYKWLRYGIIIGVVILMVFVGRKVMNTQDLKLNTEKQMAVNSGQPDAEQVASGNAVAVNNLTHDNRNTNADHQGTMDASNTQAQANNDQSSEQASLNGQNAAGGSASVNGNNAIASNGQTKDASGNKQANGGGNKATQPANLYKNNTNSPTNANGQHTDIAANATVNTNTRTQSAGAGMATNNNNSQLSANTNASAAPAGEHHNNAQQQIAASGIGVSHNRRQAAKADGVKSAANNYNSNVAQAGSGRGSHKSNNPNNVANKPAPITHNKGNTAHGPLLSSRLKKGNIAAYPGKTTKVEYTQNDMKTVKGEQKTASQAQDGSHVKVGNADIATSEAKSQETAGSQAKKSSPFRIPDGNNNVASANIGSVDNKGVLANGAASNNANTGGTSQATASAAGSGNHANANATSNAANINATASNANTNGGAASGATHLDETNIASDRYNAAAAANWNAKQPGERTGLADNHNNTVASNTERRMAKPLLIESGIKAGYEIGFQHFAANKYVISPYIEYTKGRFGLSIQPTFKWARMNHTSNLGSTDVYYNVTNQPRLVNEVDSIFAQTLTKSRTLYYEEAHDSIVVRHHIATKAYTELEVPLLLNFKATPNLQVFGGFLLDYTSIVQIQEDRTVNSYTRDAVVRQEYSTLAPEPAMPDANSLYQYPGVAYALYSTKGYDNVTSSKLTFGYMLGVNYTIKDRYLIDVSLLQNLSNMNYIPNDKVRGVYTQPYVRISAGYKFLQGNKKKK
ncbi:MAG: hypothetical protein JSS82_02395 [Bacteroidetes bacterium]|nr:hypothetical protein [Bacteroidota bacterium]